jgi:hypothetical protein
MEKGGRQGAGTGTGGPTRVSRPTFPHSVTSSGPSSSSDSSQEHDFDETEYTYSDSWSEPSIPDTTSPERRQRQDFSLKWPKDALMRSPPTWTIAVSSPTVSHNTPLIMRVCYPGRRGTLLQVVLVQDSQSTHVANAAHPTRIFMGPASGNPEC